MQSYSGWDLSSWLWLNHVSSSSQEHTPIKPPEAQTGIHTNYALCVSKVFTLREFLKSHWWQKISKIIFFKLKDKHFLK